MFKCRCREVCGSAIKSRKWVDRWSDRNKVVIFVGLYGIGQFYEKVKSKMRSYCKVGENGT